MSQPSEPRTPRFCAHCGQRLPGFHRGRPRKVIDLERVRVLLESGLSIREAARRLGLGATTLRDAIRAAGMLFRASERHRHARAVQLARKRESRIGAGTKNTTPAP